MEPGRALPYDQRWQNDPNSHLSRRNHRRAQGQVYVLCNGWNAYMFDKSRSKEGGRGATDMEPDLSLV